VAWHPKTWPRRQNIALHGAACLSLLLLRIAAGGAKALALPAAKKHGAPLCHRAEDKAADATAAANGGIISARTVCGVAYISGL
jgi:hypothetical protein